MSKRLRASKRPRGPINALVPRLLPSARVAAALLSVALVAGACSSDSPTDARPPDSRAPIGDSAALAPRSTVDLSNIELVADLTTAGDCDGLLTRLREVGDAHVGPYGFGYSYGGGIGIRGGFAEDRAVSSLAVPQALPGEATGAPVQEKGSDFSGTNNQEAGVDEADLVKTDGRLMVIARGDRLVVIDVSGGPGAARQLASLGLGDEPGSPSAQSSTYYDPGVGVDQLFFDGTHVMAIGQRYQPWPEAVPTAAAEEKGATATAETDPTKIAEQMPGPRTVVRMIDLSDPAAPKITDTVEIDGTLAAARLVDGKARLVVRSEPLALPFVQPQSLIGETTAEEMNRRILAEAPLDLWVPHLWRDGQRGDLVTCDRVYVPVTFAGLSMTSVVTIPLAAERAETSTTSLLAPGDVTYTSPKSLYVTAQAWVDPQVLQRGNLPEVSNWKTAVHRFDLDGDSATYVASGEVPGVVRNSFSMGEVADHLGIATTSGAPWSTTDQSKSQLITLRVEDDKLVQSGSVENLGLGESIYSVRYVGTKAYVVTFRQTDPFYVVDLTDPAAPKLAGELKITGYSGYLHPISDTRILGIGRAADENGRDQGMKATLFDTSDPAAPREVGTWTDRNGWSDVEWDHHAFLYWDPTKLAVFPQTNGGFDEGPEMVGLRVGDSLTEAGRIRITPPTDKGASQCRKLTKAEISKYTGQDAEYYVGDQGFIQVCEPGQLPGASGYSCWRITSEQIAAATGGKTPEEIGLGDGGLQTCTENGWQPIERSIVIGDTLWVLAGDVLQANDLATLAPGPQVRIG